MARPQYTPDPQHRFFIYDPNDAEFHYFATATERDQYNDTVIQAYLDDGWDDTVARVVAGEITHSTQQVDRVERPPAEEINDEGYDAEGRYWDDSWDHYCNYQLLPLQAAPETPGPDAGQAVAQRLASAATQRLALHDYTEALAAQIRDVVAGLVDINTARRNREAWEAALLQRLQAPMASLEKGAP